jgi:hypothetical protein
MLLLLAELDRLDAQTPALRRTRRPWSRLLSVGALAFTLCASITGMVAHKQFG